MLSSVGHLDQRLEKILNCLHSNICASIKLYMHLSSLSCMPRTPLANKKHMCGALMNNQNGEDDDMHTTWCGSPNATVASRTDVESSTIFIPHFVVVVVDSGCSLFRLSFALHLTHLIVIIHSLNQIFNCANTNNERRKDLLVGQSTMPNDDDGRQRRPKCV